MTDVFSFVEACYWLGDPQEGRTPAGRGVGFCVTTVESPISVESMPLESDHARRAARRLHILLEPVAAGSYFAPETASAYEAIGLPEASGYWCGRSAPLGRVPTEVVVATFAVWEPSIVAKSLETGWASGVTHASVMAARIRGAGAFVERGLNGAPPKRIPELLRRATEAIFPAGYPLFAALASTPWPEEPATAFWFGADLLREQRNDAHIASWRAVGLDPVETHILSALWSGQPFHLRAAFMGWRRSHITSAKQRLEARALIEGDLPTFTEAGREVRAEIEEATDRQQRPALDALGADVDDLLDLLEPTYQALLPTVVDRGSRTGGVATSGGSTAARLPDPELLNPL